MANILFIGLGNMGFPMAGHLASQGHNLIVANRSQGKVENWLKTYSGCPFSEHTAFNQIEVVILCVGKDEDVEEWLIERNLLEQLTAGTLVIDHTTTSSELAEKMSKTAQKSEIFFCDVPVSGGQQGAQSGQLSLMCGSDEAVYQKIKEVTSAYTKAIEYMGPPGSGQKTKMVNQICVAGLIQALSEGMNFADKSGLDVAKVMNLVGQGAAASWQLTNRHKTMMDNQYNHGFAVDLMHKDLQICLSTARDIGIPLPITELVNSYYQELQQQGHGTKDTSSLLLRLQEIT